MSDDHELEQHLARSRARLKQAERKAAIYRATIAAAVEEIEAQGVPREFRYVNMDLDEAMIIFLRDEMSAGATEQEIIDGLRVGGLAWNAKDFDKNVRASIRASLRTGTFIPDGDRIVWSGKYPARFKDRHKK
jgi:hypothetical protein